MVRVSLIGFGRKYGLMLSDLQTGLTLYISSCIKQGLPYGIPQLPNGIALIAVKFGLQLLTTD